MLKKVITGLIAGLICGFFSTGGGMILVPAFVYIIKKTPIEARATSVCCILPMVLTSAMFYYQGNYINWNLGFLCAIGGGIGGFIGAKSLGKIPDYIIKIIFIVFLLYVSYSFIFK